MKSSPVRFFGIFCCLLLLWGGALGIRRAVFHQQTRTMNGEEAPFLMESALQFRMTQMVNENGRLPEVDEKVQVPEGVVMRETYSVGAEQVYTFIAKFLPESWSFAQRVRWASAGVFCLAIPLAALWIGLNVRSMMGGFAGGLLLAVSPAFAVRSSGLELSRENVAIPLFVLFLLATVLFDRAERKGAKWSAACLSGVAIALAQCSWDLSQYIIGLWVVWGWGSLLMGKTKSEDDRVLWTVVSLCLVVVSMGNPYLRAHGFFYSPVMALLLARAVVGWIPTSDQGWKLLVFPVSFWGLWFLLGHFFVDNYSHFGELLYAKLRYLNVKPENPALLTYTQRIMWTPALNSSTWQLTKSYFPIAITLFGISLLSLIWGMIRGRCRFQAEYFYAGFTLIVYVFFFRFHVFLILFIAACIGAWVASAKQNDSILTRRILPLLGLLLFMGVECYLLLFFEPKPSGIQLEQQKQMQMISQAMGGSGELPKGNRWGRPGAAYGYLESLSAEMRQLSEVQPVLANFGISASILAETGFPIVLHPKFESPGIRERVQQFYEQLFLHSEKEFRDWAVTFGAKYYVHSMGNFSDIDPRNSPRYMVDALEPPAGSAIYVLENEPEKAVWFRPIYSNPRYKIYQIISEEDVNAAESMTRMSMMAYEMGDMKRAKEKAMQALSYYWKYEPAQQMLKLVLSQPRL
ncbi:hypothetical protein P3T73_07605 [Kiritimatiellota bacterium B12222]|nr:hypothetical protein P3T73_07605 [Kiritimatiellota bacterium B12222]